MDRFIFAVIQICCLAIMVVYGKKLSETRSNKHYWLVAIVPLIAYGFTYGFRFGRLIDWNVYYYRYVNLGKNMELEDYEWIFEHVCHYLYELGVPYPGFIFLQCLFFMFSILLLLSANKDIVRWGLPIGFVLGGGNEMFIRYYMGFSFSIIAIYYLTRTDCRIVKRYVLAIIFALMGGLSHNACYFMVLLIATYRIMNLKAIPWQASVPLLFLTTFIFNISQFSFLVDIANYISALSGDEFHGAGYLDHVDDLIAGDFMSVGYMSNSIQTNIRTFCYTAPVFYYASKLLREKSSDVYFYNMFVIGAVLNPCFGTVELLNRISSSMLFFGFFPCALWYIYALRKKKAKQIEFYMALISVFFLVYPYVNDALLRPEEKGLLFIWDANGRNCLPY